MNQIRTNPGGRQSCKQRCAMEGATTDDEHARPRSPFVEEGRSKDTAVHPQDRHRSWPTAMGAGRR